MLSKKYLIVYGIVSILPIVITLVAYPFLPDIIPTRFGFDNIATSFGSKSHVWIIALIFLSVDIVALITNINLVKKNKKNYSVLKIKSELRISLVSIIFLDIIYFVILYGSARYNEANPINITEITGIGVFALCFYAIYEAIRIGKI